MKHNLTLAACLPKKKVFRDINCSSAHPFEYLANSLTLTLRYTHN